jgi:hypothetical protein
VSFYVEVGLLIVISRIPVIYKDFVSEY